MKVLIGWALALVCAAMLLVSTAEAQETSFRSGVITAITPVQGGAAEQPKQRGAFSRILGRAASRAVGRAALRATGDYGYASDAQEIAGATVDDVASGVGTAGGGASAFMVMIRFDDGSESAIQSTNVNGLRIGGRARVFGSGRSAQIVGE